MSQNIPDPFGAAAKLETRNGPVTVYRLDTLENRGAGNVHRLPIAIKVLLEAVLRQVDGRRVTEQDVDTLLAWGQVGGKGREIPFKPARVLMQDFTGVPAVVDLAALRSAMKRLGGDPRRINPLIPVDLVIDHSLQVDRFGTPDAAAFNLEREFERNQERYTFLRWGAEAFDRFRVVPPATGIIHQVNLEYLASVVQVRSENGKQTAFPDSLVGTDSHTTMINGLGVIGWGVGGIEAEAAILGQPLFMLPPDVVGFKLDGELPPGATATDLVLTVTQRLREHGVVGKFVEYFGSGLEKLSLADRATVANMSPEYGATMGFFPVDGETLSFLRDTGRDPALVEMVERYCKEQGLFHTPDSPRPEYSDTLALDMSTVEPSIAGPKRPQDRIALREAKPTFRRTLEKSFGVTPDEQAPVAVADPQSEIQHGSVVIASITSCTNTSNPSVMLGAGLLAKKAVECGLKVAPHVKTSLAPGSRVVTRYLEEAGVLSYLNQLGFNLVGYGCATCIGNSGPLPDAVSRAVRDHDLVVTSVLSGNRNFEGRISPDVKANYLASPPLVVAYALAGTLDFDFEARPLGHHPDGQAVYLRDIWPSAEAVQELVRNHLGSELFRTEYGEVFAGNEMWDRIAVSGGELYEWSETSTYVKEPPFFQDMKVEPGAISPIRQARVLALLGNTVTTDHISPAGAIPADGPAGRYLIEQGVEVRDFNSFGSRRGNHEVMMRGTFANIRIRNQLAPGTEGGWTRHLPTGEQVSMYEAARRYRQEGIPLLVIAGKEYGTGSSRDWAAKGTMLLGVKAVIAQSYERIHRSNLVGMGVLPLQFHPGEGSDSLKLTGEEVFDIDGLGADLRPGQTLTVRANAAGGSEKTFEVVARLDSGTEVDYFFNGGILNTVLRELIRG
jgi:aconitate hydratase